MTSHVASGRSVEASGRTVEQAIEAALARMGRDRDSVRVQVLREASKGVLGFGAHDAIVRVTELVEGESLEAAPVLSETSAPAAEAMAEVELFEEEEEPEPIPVRRATRSLRDEDDEQFDEVDRDQLLETSREVLLDILGHMNVIADVLATWSEPEDEEDEPALILDIIGDDLGLLIGRRGETLRDLQYILRLIVGRRIHGWANIVVDVEGYKHRREQTVRQLARRMADRVISTGRPVHLEPMNGYERRLVHLELRKMDGVSTKSAGEGEHRKVGIFPA